MLTAISPRLYADLIGKPFAEGGRGPSAYDCLGLTIELVRRCGFDVPDYASTAEELARQHSDGLLGPCTRIDVPVPGCVVLMRDPDDCRHLGVMINRFDMIHCARYTRAVVTEQLTRSFFRSRILGYYFPEVRAAVSKPASTYDNAACAQSAYDNGGDR